MKLLLVIAALLLTGCAATPPPAEVAPAGEDQAPTPCVQACTDGRRMEATGWEVIVAECEAKCSGVAAP